MEWEGTYLNTVKIKDIFSCLSYPQILCNWILTFSFYFNFQFLTSTTGTYKIFWPELIQNMDKLQLIDKMRMKKMEVKELEAAEMKK